MQEFKGESISKGIAFGYIKTINEKINTSNYIKGSVEEEWNRFLTAREKIINDLNVKAEKMRERKDEITSEIYSMQSSLCEDLDLEDMVKEEIENGHSVIDAINSSSKSLSVMLSNMDDEYMKNRSADVLDIAKYFIKDITGQNNIPDDSVDDYIAFSDDISPATLLSIIDKLKGIILKKGSKNGHTAIVAKTRGIPMIINCNCDIDLENKNVILDGNSSKVIIDYDEETKKKYKDLEEKEIEAKEKLKAFIDKDAVTKAGQEIKVYCNIANVDEAKKAKECGAQGIGLFRSEFLYIGKDKSPSEEEQFNAYKSVLEIIGDKEVIIRTCDIGSDKPASYLNIPKEENPSLGFRAIRICLKDEEFFKTQLRALYRASIYGNLSIMFPMIANLFEVQKAKKLCEEVKAELDNEGIHYSDKVKLGIMIETPAAALISDILAKEVDFFSIGTNDLTQYTLACDRQNDNVSNYVDIHHEAIKRLIHLTSKNAHENNITVGICGALASDTELLDFFIEEKIDELSVGVSNILELKGNICSK